MMLRTVEWRENKFFIIEQNRLPAALVYIELRSVEEVAEAIQSMKVRGAPAIGAAAAAGVAIAAIHSSAQTYDELQRDIDAAVKIIRATRPTAANLFHGINRMLAALRASAGAPVSEIQARLLRTSYDLLEEDVEANRRMGCHGAALIPDGASVLTHCNAGGLATVGYGTALGVVRAAVEAGKRVHVYADETRPRLQGARLTTWELMRDGIPVTLIADNMAASLMRQGKIDCVITGADRIAANGDAANKIGTYSLAVLANAHGIPMYIAAPMSTVDLSIETGAGIPIEERSDKEMTHIEGVRIAPEGVNVYNPAFDVTPARLIAAIITEEGVLRPPYEESLAWAAKRVG
ncbi:MAG: S-methyl-5-thioribose-1-phosphate isomerase [Armatimonadota bacterium]|nr:S-methyl-5-thioribose-1-phosphate isomerase [Armatimonadota bacterium]